MTGDGNWGTVQEGRRADLILVDGNPLEDVEVIQEPLGVMAAGRWYARSVLSELTQPVASQASQGK